MTNDTRPPVAPIEGHYAMLRCEEVCGPLYPNIEILIDGDRESHGFVSDLADMQWDDNGKSEDSDKYDIIATISPEAMALVAVTADGIDIMQEGPTTTETVDPMPVADGYTLMPTKLAEALTALVPLADAACDYADQHCRAFPIETAPQDREIQVYNVMTGWYKTTFQNEQGRNWPMRGWDDWNGTWYPVPTHWAEPLPPPSNSPLPAVFTGLGAALEKIKEGR